jgi:nitric oxide reductase NorD protein
VLVAHARLVNAGYGPATARAFLSAAPRVAEAAGAEAVLALAHDASRVAIRARPRNAALYLDTAAAVAARLGDEHAFEAWRTLHIGLLKSDADALQPLLETSGKLLDRLTLDALADFVRTGLLETDGDARARGAFFRLETPEARRQLARHAGDESLHSLRRGLSAGHTAIWGTRPLLREAAEDARQASFSGAQIRLPSSFPDYRGREREIYRASLAHIGAHQKFGGDLFPIAQLKPMHVAVISLIEDARVEALAIAEMPGLRRLWAPFHDCTPEGVATAPSLFARLAHALFDPDFPVRDGWVAKGVRLFREEFGNLKDASKARLIGNILANDLGQTRVQFNFRNYLVLPVYRDDNRGLWKLPDDAHASPETETADLSEGRQTEIVDVEDAPTIVPAKPDDTVEAEPSTPPDSAGRMLLRLPEYDRATMAERPDWVTANVYDPALGDPLYLDGVSHRHAATLARLKSMISKAELGRVRRLKRQAEGEKIDLDAAIDAAVAMSAKQTPDHRVYEGTALPERSLAVHLLLDMSQSTADAVRAGATILDMERDAAAILAQAMDRLGDALAITGFASDGRHDLRLVPVKRFEDELGLMTGMGLSGLRSGYSTRIGAALRFAGETLAEQPRHHRLVLLLTDGEPSDVDVSEPGYLQADAQRAVHALRARGTDTQCIALGASAGHRLEEIFGRRGFARITDLEQLPEKLSAAYLKMTR